MALLHQLIVQSVENHYSLLIAVPGRDLIERMLQGLGEALPVLWRHHPVKLQILLVSDNHDWGLITPAAPLGAGMDVIDEKTESHDFIKAAPVGD